LLPIFAKHSPDLVTVHARTVREMYWSEVHYEFIAQAARALRCPVLANGNIYSAAKAEAVLQQTGARGLMIGRGAIRNPWMFQQIRDHLAGKLPFVPRGRDVLGYVRSLWEHSIKPATRESSQVMHMKRFMNFLGLGVDAEGKFLHDIRRVTTKAEFFAICESFLDHDQPTPLEPFKLALKESDLLAGEHH